MMVTIVFERNSVYQRVAILRNITEIHYNYRRITGRASDTLTRSKIAFESDILKTGSTYYIDDIRSFETELEIEEPKL